MMSPAEQAKVLQERLLVFQEPVKFKPGDLIVWKTGLKNKRRPLDGEPAIVVDVLEPPVFDDKEKSESTYYREPLDLIIGVLDWEDGTFLTYHSDHRRYKSFTPNAST